jgi:hypothetical protein
MIASAAMSGLGGALGQSAEGKLYGYTGDAWPPWLLNRARANVEQMGAIAAERAGMPVSLPSAFVQQPPMFRGGGLPMPIGVTGRDPALMRPLLMGRPGIRFPSPAPGHERMLANESAIGRDRWLFQGAPRFRPEDRGRMEEVGSLNPSYEGLRQPDVTMPQVGGGIPELQGALTLMGVSSDPLGNLTMGREYPLFTGASRKKRTIEPPPNLEQITQQYKDWNPPIPKGARNHPSEDI